MMLEREELLGLGEEAGTYLATLSRRQRHCLAEQIGTIYCLHQEHGSRTVLEAMAKAGDLGVYDAAYLKHLILAQGEGSVIPAAMNLPPQLEVDRDLHLYEAWVTMAPAEVVTQ